MNIISLIGLVLKLGGVAIVGVLVYTLIRSDLMSPLCMVLWMALTVGLVVLSWNTSDGDLIAVLVHGLLPAVAALFAGGVPYQTSGNGPGQYIGVVAGGVAAYLLTLLLSSFLSNIVTVILGAVLLVVLWQLFGSSIAANYEKSRAREAELKNASHSRMLEREELRELNRMTGDSFDPERDRAMADYNRYHRDDPISNKEK